MRIISVTISALAVMFLLGCSEQRPSKKSEELQKDVSDLTDEELLEQIGLLQKEVDDLDNKVAQKEVTSFAELMYRKDSILLSYKHELPSEKVFNLLRDANSLKDNDISLIRLSLLGSAEEYNNGILKLATKNELSTKVVSEVIFDYVIMHNTKNCDY